MNTLIFLSAEPWLVIVASFRRITHHHKLKLIHKRNAFHIAENHLTISAIWKRIYFLFILCIENRAAVQRPDNFTDIKGRSGLTHNRHIVHIIRARTVITLKLKIRIILKFNIRRQLEYIYHIIHTVNQRVHQILIASICANISGCKFE
eukprot:UN07382